MTKNNPVSISTIFSERLLIFEFFKKYWEAVINVEDERSAVEAYHKRCEIFETLDAIWRKNRWNCNELIKICSKIDQSLEELNPNMFFGKGLGYIDHIKSWYQIEYFPF